MTIDRRDVLDWLERQRAKPVSLKEAAIIKLLLDVVARPAPDKPAGGEQLAFPPD